MASDNSDSDDSLNDFQLTDNIKKEIKSPTKRNSVSSTSSSEELNKSPGKSLLRKISPARDEFETSINKERVNATSTKKNSSPEKRNTSKTKSRVKSVDINSTSSLPLNLQHYISKYDIQCITQVEAGKALVDIDSDEEVFIVQASKDFNLKEFVDKKLNIEKTNQLETSDGISLEYYVENFNKPLNLVLICGSKTDNAMKVNTLKPNGKIIIREKLFIEQSKGLDAIQIEQHKKVPFPRDLKVRHPLLGAFYEDKINLPSKIVKQLQTPKVKKIKKERSVENHSIVEMKQLDYSETVEDVPPKKHKKSIKVKRERSVERETDKIDGIEYSPKKKKVKLEKFDDDNDFSWLSQI